MLFSIAVFYCSFQCVRNASELNTASPFTFLSVPLKLVLSCIFFYATCLLLTPSSIEPTKSHNCVSGVTDSIGLNLI